MGLAATMDCVTNSNYGRGMAIIKCSECQGKVSDTATACPHCGAPPVKQNPTLKSLSSKAEDMPRSFNLTVGKVLGLVLVAIIAVSCIVGGDNKSEVSPAATEPAKPKALTKIEALTMCQMLIQRASRDPEKTDVPYIEGVDTGAEFTFKWDRNSKLARMRNGLGLEVGATAFCSINKERREFTLLNIDGQNVPLK